MPIPYFGGEEKEFEVFHFSPFSAQADNEYDAPITQGQLKAIKKKLDSLLESTKASSSDSYSQEAIKALIKTTLKEHAANLEKANKVVENSAVTCKEATKKVDKLNSDARSFMRTFQGSNETNTTKANISVPHLRLRWKLLLMFALTFNTTTTSFRIQSPQRLISFTTN